MGESGGDLLFFFFFFLVVVEEIRPERLRIPAGMRVNERNPLFCFPVVTRNPFRAVKGKERSR
jgi:hypothetical protein